MPELPEMENYKSLLSPRIAGKMIVDIRINREKSINLPKDTFIYELKETQVLNVTRRAKQVLFHMNTGKTLLLHLMLGGSLYWGTNVDKLKRNTQIEIDFSEHTLYFIGLRLGFLHLLSPEQMINAINHLGHEPMDGSFSEQEFSHMINGKKGKLKSLLTNQSWIAGIGNCYADEICFVAELLPYRLINSLHFQEISRLYHAIRSVFSEAIAAGGYMESPFYVGDTLTGGYNSLCKVYDREGQPCLRCGQLIERQDIASRKSFCCSQCQH
jgi:formamidopyrimidine-DNA glycosylase